ncbi:MAG: hypothetical protein BGP08_15570 [Rhizobiales bacterium 64-17]|nr:MAG: hypothetical protein BGP08_15570 [Rhizobiales bacterium 64-17]
MLSTLGFLPSGGSLGLGFMRAAARRNKLFVERPHARCIIGSELPGLGECIVRFRETGVAFGDGCVAFAGYRRNACVDITDPSFCVFDFTGEQQAKGSCRLVEFRTDLVEYAVMLLTLGAAAHGEERAIGGFYPVRDIGTGVELCFVGHMMAMRVREEAVDSEFG